MHIRTATLDDAAAIAEIYNQGIEERVATYETRRRSAEDQQAWLQDIAGRYPAVVAQINGEIIGWAGAGPYRTGDVIGALANFRCTSIATGDVEARVIYCSLVSSAKRSGWGCGNCYRASFLSTRPVALSAANTASVRSACTKNMRASMVAGLTS